MCTRRGTRSTSYLRGITITDGGFEEQFDMRTVIAISMAVCLSSPCLADEFNPFEGPKPIAVWIQSDPWADVIGAETPRVVVYENGEIIFLKKVEERYAYHHVAVDKGAFEKVRDELQPLLKVKDLKPGYNMTPNVTDQPLALFYLRDGVRDVITRVYGLKAPGTKLAAHTVFPDRPKPDAPPVELRKLHKWFYRGDFPNSTAWTPKYIEVLFWDYEKAPDPSIQWPKEWPALESERAIKRGDSYSIFLDGDQLPKFQEFAASRKPKGAVELAGKKWAMSARFAFPGEPTWRTALWGSAEQKEREEGKEAETDDEKKEVGDK
jgi:hypothetical protein